MAADRVFAIPGLAAFLAVALLFCPCGCATKPAPQPTGDIVKETAEATAREQVQEQKEWSETMEKLRSMWKDLGVEVAPNELPDTMGIFGLEQLKENAEAAQKNTAKIVVTEQDLRALDAYAAGQFQRVEELLKDAADAPAKRPFPPFLRGCALFELKRFADAAGCFDEALSLEKDSRMCCLLAEMSRRLEKSPDATDDDVWTAYDFAYKATMDRMPMPKEEGQTPSFAAAFTSPITFDPIRLRLDHVAARIRQKRELGILQDYLKATDLDRQLVLALLMDEKVGRLAIISLSYDHPENKELQVYAFLVRYYSGADDKYSKRGPDYAQDFAAAQADEPENGWLVLLGISDTDDNYKQPLNAAEIDLLKRAVHCKEFDTHWGYRARQVARESRARGGECFEPWSEGHTYPHVASAIGDIVRRTSPTIAGLFEDGKEAEAQALLSDIQLLIAKLRSEHAYNISANGMTASISRKLGEYAVGAKRADLLEQALPPWEAAVRWETVAEAGASDLQAFVELPIRRVRWMSLSDPPSSFFENRALRMLRLYPDRFRDEALENLRWVNAEGRKSFLGEYNAIVILQMLKDPKTLPVLEPIVGHADPLLSRLAQEAIAVIKRNP